MQGNDPIKTFKIYLELQCMYPPLYRENTELDLFLLNSHLI